MKITATSNNGIISPLNLFQAVTEPLRKTDGEYTIEVKKKRQGRSNDQNALYWLVLGWFEKETGNAKEDMHEYLKEKFLKRSIDFSLNGKQYVREVIKSTTILTIKEFSEYYNKVGSWFCEIGYSPPPLDYLENDTS